MPFLDLLTRPETLGSGNSPEALRLARATQPEQPRVTRDVVAQPPLERLPASSPRSNFRSVPWSRRLMLSE